MLTRGHVGLRRPIAACLGEGDAVDDGVQRTRAVAIQAVSAPASGRGLDGGDAGEGSELGLPLKDTTPNQADEHASREPADAVQSHQRRGDELAQVRDARGESVDVGEKAFEMACDALDGGELDRLEWSLERRGIGQDGEDSLPRVDSGQVSLVARVELQQCGVEAIAQPRGVLLELLSLLGEES